MLCTAVAEYPATNENRPVLTSYDDGYEHTIEHMAELREMLRDEEDELVEVAVPV